MRAVPNAFLALTDARFLLWRKFTLEQIDLSPRLKMVAELVPQGARLADIGTDHAFLPAYLLVQKRVVQALAADCRSGPLARARRTLETSGLSDRVDLVLSDGFQRLSPDRFDCAVLAGMGGELIARLIDEAPFLKDTHYTLVLQPMTKAEKLREYLWRSGYAIVRERFCREEERLYTALQAVYTGKRSSVPPLRCLIGAGRGDPLYSEYLGRLRERLLRQAEGLSRSGRAPEELRRCRELLAGIEAEQKEGALEKTES